VGAANRQASPDAANAHGPDHSDVLERIKQDVTKMVGWGYELIK